MTTNEERSAAGVVLMAYSDRQFLSQAADMIRSLRRHSPDAPIALITQWPGSRTAQMADVVVPMPVPAAGDCRPKLDLDLLTPFRRTLYLDVDSLVVRDVAAIFDRLAGLPIAVFGEQIADGRWYTDVSRLRAMAGGAEIPKFSGGIIYLESGAVASGVFEHARHLAERYADLELDTFAGGVADEPLLAVALARAGLRAHPVGDSSWSLLGVTEPPRLDVLSGTATFVKRGTPVKPVVVHFASLFSERLSLAGAYYRRERVRLRLAGLGCRTASFVAHAVHGVGCLTYDTLLRLHARRPARWSAWALEL